MKKYDNSCESGEIIKVLIAETESLLRDYKKNYEGLTWREKVLLLTQLDRPIKKLGKYSNPDTANVGAVERIRLYLLENTGQIIDAKELEVVGGISQYARRVRELRVQDGYKIITGASIPEDSTIKLKPSQYILLEREPDLKAAHRWHIANRIRKSNKGGSKERILKYLKNFVGEVVTSEELYYVARAKEFGRRVRELRTEEGYAISTCFTGRPDLNISEYILESEQRIAQPHDRKIPYDIQKFVYQRDNNSCSLCGWNIQRWSKQDPRILELHHLLEHAKGGVNLPENIILICSSCHDKVHAGKLAVPDNILD